MSIYITQLIYLKTGQEETFDQFEAFAIPIIGNYNGRLLLRMRPTAGTILESGIETPYEVHLIEFATEADFNDFMKDEERKKFLHLKERSVRSVLLLKGSKL